MRVVQIRPRLSSVLKNGVGYSRVGSTINKGNESDADDDPDEFTIEEELSVDEIVRKRIRDAEEKGDEIVLY